MCGGGVVFSGEVRWRNAWAVGVARAFGGLFGDLPAAVGEKLGVFAGAVSGAALAGDAEIGAAGLA